MALVAQAERQAISRRTKEALAVARARAVGLGNPNGAAALRRAGTGGVALRAAVSANADRFAADLAPVVADIRASGHVSLRAIAAELKTRRMLTRRGGQWSVGNVGNLERRVGKKVMSKSFTSVHVSISNHFGQERAFHSRTIYKTNRDAALAEWRGLFAA